MRTKKLGRNFRSCRTVTASTMMAQFDCGAQGQMSHRGCGKNLTASLDGPIGPIELVNVPSVPRFHQVSGCFARRTDDLFRNHLQPPAAALCAGLPAARRIRAGLAGAKARRSGRMTNSLPLPIGSGLSAEAQAPFTGKPYKRPDSTWAGL